jgi:hypothetical protein
MTVPDLDIFGPLVTNPKLMEELESVLQAPAPSVTQAMAFALKVTLNWKLLNHNVAMQIIVTAQDRKIQI